MGVGTVHLRRVVPASGPCTRFPSTDRPPEASWSASCFGGAQLRRHGVGSIRRPRRTPKRRRGRADIRLPPDRPWVHPGATADWGGRGSLRGSPHSPSTKCVAPLRLHLLSASRGRRRDAGLWRHLQGRVGQFCPCLREARPAAPGCSPVGRVPRLRRRMPGDEDFRDPSGASRPHEHAPEVGPRQRRAVSEASVDLSTSNQLEELREPGLGVRAEHRIETARTTVSVLGHMPADERLRPLGEGYYAPQSSRPGSRPQVSCPSGARRQGREFVRIHPAAHDQAEHSLGSAGPEQATYLGDLRRCPGKPEAVAHGMAGIDPRTLAGRQRPNAGGPT